MVKIDTLFQKGLISKINELEIERYVNFFESSYLDNLNHSEYNVLLYPRWSIISGYYAMHDIVKLLLVKKFKIKIEFKVHKTVIELLKILAFDEELRSIFGEGYKEFISIANDLAQAKKERERMQYYTGTAFLKEIYQKRANNFREKIVIPFIDKISEELK